MLYDHMSTEARVMIGERYLGKKGIALLLTFESVEHCNGILGSESDPRACEAHSLRAIYGSRTEPERLGEWQWWENAIHRPIDERERVRDLLLVFPKNYQSAG